MGTQNLPTKTIADKRKDIAYVAETFQMKQTIEQLQFMMKEVTKSGISAATVNAACNCVQQLNCTIDMAIKASRYLSEKDE
jgi:predicted Abi (CAAX) family protease